MSEYIWCGSSVWWGQIMVMLLLVWWRANQHIECLKIKQLIFSVMGLFAHVGHTDVIFSQSGFQCLIFILIYIYIYYLPVNPRAPVQLNQSHSAVAIFMFPFSWMHCGYVVSKEEDENDFLPTYKALIGRLLLHSHQKQHQWHHSTRPIWIRVSFSHESHATCRGIHDFIRANFAVGHI